MIGSVHGFTMDPSIAALERAAIFGHDAWQYTHFLLGSPLGTFMLQIESVVFLPRHLPPGFVSRLFAMGAVIGLVAAPAAVWIHRRFRPSPVGGPVPSGIPSAPEEWIVRLAWLAATYVALYFLAGHFIAYRNPDVVAYYDDSNVGSFPRQMLKVWTATPWLFPERGAV